MNEYSTVLGEAKKEFIEKKSRFICSVKPVYNEQQAVDFIKKISGFHKSASHNVFAYIISGDVENQRASDDGEPQGTAGIPVLEVIKREGLTNVCVVVTRYFGGILLGAGGLIRSYSTCAKLGLYEAKICRMILYNKIGIVINYNQLGRLQSSMASLGNTIVNIDYTDFVKIYLKIKYNKIEYTVKMITELTNGEANIEYLEKFYDIE